MRIMVVSDIRWEFPWPGPTGRRLTSATCIELISQESLDCLVLLGDVIGDGGIDDSYHNELARVIDAIGVPTIVILGNHDLSRPKGLAALRHLLGRRTDVKFRGCDRFRMADRKFLVLDWSVCSSVKQLKQLVAKSEECPEVVFAHCGAGHRIWIASLAPAAVITGHSGRGEFLVRRTRFAMNDSFPNYYTILTVGAGGGVDLEQKAVAFDNQEVYRGSIVNLAPSVVVQDGPFHVYQGVWRSPSEQRAEIDAGNDRLPSLGLDYGFLLDARQTLDDGNCDQEQRIQLYGELLARGIPKKWISEFLGGGKALDAAVEPTRLHSPTPREH